MGAPCPCRRLHAIGLAILPQRARKRAREPPRDVLEVERPGSTKAYERHGLHQLSPYAILRRPIPKDKDVMDAKPLKLDARNEADPQDSQAPRKPYTAPRLTKHGSIVTQTGPTVADFSAPV
jgi:hypothetical protein